MPFRLLIACTQHIAIEPEPTLPAGTEIPACPEFSGGTEGIRDLCLTENPNSTLSFTLSWTTDEPATSTVEFGSYPTPVWRLDQPESVHTHSVTVYGMRANTDISLNVLSVTASGHTLAARDLLAHTGELPFGIPVGIMGVVDPYKKQPGWTLLNINQREANWPPSAVIMDEMGQPVWYAITATAVDERGDLDVSLTPDGTILIGGSGPSIRPVELNLAGNVVWNGPPQDAPQQHHHFQREPDGTTVMLRHAFDDAFPAVVLDRIVQIDDDYNVVWEWNGFDHIDFPLDATDDYTHGNSVTMTDDAVYYNSRNLHTLFKISRHTGDILWELGEDLDFAPDPDHATPWFAHQHAPELQDDGSWLIHDNDGIASHSRVIQMVIDEDAMTSEIIWEFPGDFSVAPWYTDTWHSGIWGDADRLENGNVLITAAMREFDTQSRIFEVTPDGEVVWEILLPAVDDSLFVVGSYRADRIVPPGLIAIESD